jgi:hypothetical protein
MSRTALDGFPLLNDERQIPGKSIKDWGHILIIKYSRIEPGEPGLTNILRKKVDPD